tara:strand:+ start:797 stop:964 length:168 start_codon:yes stop_codon:yes gene_type:complete
MSIYFKPKFYNMKRFNNIQSFKLSKEDKEFLLKKAIEGKMPVSSYIRHKLLAGQV